MCGIVGYWGPKSPQAVIIEGLKKLEYRGYDSAGIAILDGQNLRRVRAQGKLVNLERKLEAEPLSGHLAIGHTRWATHGIPSESNAHPHLAGDVCIVHNGIIENYKNIRIELESAGVTLNSQTDSELIAHLLDREVKETGDLFMAVQRVLPKLEGAYSVLALWTQSPNTMVAFKNGPPLILGIGEGEVVVASDVQPILPYTRKIIYLEDGEIAVVEGSQWKVCNRDGSIIDKLMVHVEWTPEAAEKMGFPHYMLKEIYEQPRSVAATLNQHLSEDRTQIRLQRMGFGGTPLEDLGAVDLNEDWERTCEIFKAVERVFILACGTSYYAAMVGEYLIEKLAKLPVEVDIASEFRYRSPVVPPHSLVITISQSGETADTLAALRLAKSQGAKILSLCNVPRSSIDREAHGHFYLNSGVEIGVASTKAFTSMLVAMNILAVALAKVRREILIQEEQEIVASLLAVPSQMETVLAHDNFFKETADLLKDYRGFLYLGRGVCFPIAMEGALKLKELAYMHAEGYAAGEMKHGPLALIDERMVVVTIAPNDELYDKTISNLEEAKARGGEIVGIGTGNNERLQALSTHYLALPKAPWYVNPILAVVPLQMMAYRLADKLGLDVDQPRNLAKSVTVE
jgi:glucosamine--fructose-6-phosphate aminotransferase (isomerizing)